MVVSKYYNNEECRRPQCPLTAIRSVIFSQTAHQIEPLVALDTCQGEGDSRRCARRHFT